MAFIREIVSEEGMDFLKSFHIPTPSGCGDGEWIDEYFSLGLTKWLVDKERDLIFITLCGQGFRFDIQHPPTYHYLIWKGQPIKIETFDKGAGDRTTGVRTVWAIHRIVAPITLGVDAETVSETVKEAIEARERTRYKHFLSIEFVKVATPVFVKGDVAYG